MKGEENWTKKGRKKKCWKNKKGLKKKTRKHRGEQQNKENMFYNLKGTGSLEEFHALRWNRCLMKICTRRACESPLQYQPGHIFLLQGCRIFELQLLLLHRHLPNWQAPTASSNCFIMTLSWVMVCDLQWRKSYSSRIWICFFFE